MLLRFRHPSATAAILAAICAFNQTAAAQDVRAAQQLTITYVLTRDSLATVNAIRNSCAAGLEVGRVAQERQAGLYDLPDASDYCITALTRLGRDGMLASVRDTRSDQVAPALAFDRGFVTAFRNREAISSDLPSMTALKPLAERCLSQAEVRTDLCSAAGYALGTRAFHGETIVIR